MKRISFKKSLPALVLSYSLAFVIWAGALAPFEALACTCLPRNPQAYLDEADVVFTGKVLRIERGWDDFEVKFQILDRRKMDDDDKTVIVHTAFTGAECGYSFKVGETYVVYAIEMEDHYYTDLCSGNHKYLGK